MSELHNLLSDKLRNQFSALLYEQLSMQIYWQLYYDQSYNQFYEQFNIK